MAKFYTGIGSRETPDEVLELMRRIGHRMAQLNYVGRSGYADGADSAFYDGFVDFRKQFNSNSVYFNNYLPWKSFNNADLREVSMIDSPALANYKKAEEIAADLHPAWDRLTRGPRALHTRNVFQVLGDDLKSPSKVVICYARPVSPVSNMVQGGTGQAVRLALQHNIPVYNLYKPETRACLCEKLGLN